MRLLQFAAILLTALALVPAGAHLLELPNKILLGQQDYLTVQQIYRGWSLLGSVLLAAVLTDLLLAVRSRQQRRPFVLATAAFLLMGTVLATFFLWTYPVNQATDNWTTTPEPWEALRAQWEYSHAAAAVLALLALGSVTASALLWRDAPARAGEPPAQSGASA